MTRKASCPEAALQSCRTAGGGFVLAIRRGWSSRGRAGRTNRSRAISHLRIALAAMLAQQTCATMGRSVVPLVAPAIVAGLEVSPALVGVYLSLSSAAAFLSTLGCGGFILR